MEMGGSNGQSFFIMALKGVADENGSCVSTPPSSLLSPRCIVKEMLSKEHWKLPSTESSHELS